MFFVSNPLQQYISSLLVARLPIICCSKFPMDEVIQFILSLFSEAYCVTNKAIKLTHPDILMLGECGKKLAIDDVRKAINFVSKVNFELDSQLIIVRALEQISMETSHSLLKMLEESGGLDYTVCFISNNEPSLRHNKVPGVLDTIMSRCVVVYLPQSKVQVLSDDSISVDSIGSIIDKANYYSGINSNKFVDMATQVIMGLHNES